MNAREATNILGTNRARWELKNMARALSLFPWQNTTQEKERWEATNWALHHWREYQEECGRRRDRRRA